MSFHLLFIAANTAIDGHQSTPLYIKLFCGINLPLVMTVPTQRFAFVFLF
jgi:hypothetical protein